MAQSMFGLTFTDRELAEVDISKARKCLEDANVLLRSEFGKATEGVMYDPFNREITAMVDAILDIEEVLITLKSVEEKI